MESKLEREKNQREFREIHAKYDISQAQATDLITKETNQKVSARKSPLLVSQPKSLISQELPELGGFCIQKSNNDTLVYRAGKNRIKDRGKINNS
jgi:hypothetical protein